MNDNEFDKILKNCGTDIRLSSKSFFLEGLEREKRRANIQAAINKGFEPRQIQLQKWFVPRKLNLGIGIGALCLLFLSLSLLTGKRADESNNYLARNEQLSSESDTDYGIGDAYTELQNAVRGDEEETGVSGDDGSEFVEVAESDGLPDYVSLSVDSPNMFYEEESENETDSIIDS